jgi:hypothetical protein
MVPDMENDTTPFAWTLTTVYDDGRVEDDDFAATTSDALELSAKTQREEGVYATHLVVTEELDVEDERHNAYNSPEKLGLTILGQLYDPNSYYDFHDLIVWAHNDGRIFYATDSGCSCPSPFEDYNTLASLTEVCQGGQRPRKHDKHGNYGRVTWAEFQEDVEDHPGGWAENSNDPQAADKTQLLAKVSAMVPR